MLVAGLSLIIFGLVLIICAMLSPLFYYKKISHDGIYLVTVYDKSIDTVTVIPFTNKTDSLTAYHSFKSSEQTHEIVGYYTNCILNEKFNFCMHDKVKMWIKTGR